MKKFIRYLYEYRNGRRVQNVGFVKVEESDDSAVIQIYGKGFPAAGNQALEILLFYLEGNQIIGIPMGELQGSHQVSGYQLIYDSSDVGGWENFRRIEGVILRQNHSQMPRLFMSTWQERPVDVSNMVERRTQAEAESKQEELVMEAESRMESSQMESSEEMQESRDSQMRSGGYSETPRMRGSEYSETPQMSGEQSSENSSMRSGGYSETPQMRSGQNSEESQLRSGQYSEGSQSRSGQNSETSQPSRERSEEMSQVVHKIGRQDLVALPRNEWKLANNHFLMHGCRNFHHLLSFEKDGECWLGVPGIYHPKEQSAAHAFGFGQFMKPEEGDVMLSEDEHTSNGEFGYWCRTVSKVIDKSKL